MTSTVLHKFDSSVGVLIVGHGSRNSLAVEEFARLASLIKASLPGIPLEYGYLEFAKPIISTALDRLKAQSVKKIIAIPAMLFAAGHAKNDIPALLNLYGEKAGLEIIYGRELGINNLMIGAAGERVNEAIKSARSYPISKTLLVVVGRGSSDPDANSNVSKITRMLVEGLGFGWGQTVYSGVTFPLVEPGLRQIVKLGFDRIVVFPYFLFSGVLVSRIRKQTKSIAFEYPKIEFLNANYLGIHPLVIKTFLERINEVINGDNSMNCSLCKYRSNLLGFEKEVGTPQVSHHHHVEGIESCTLCESECTSQCDLLGGKDQNHDHDHDHARVPYPQSNHPFGPVTLRYSSKTEL